MNDDLISVIVPVYNAERWINKCLDSLLAQTIINKIEIIVVDDGSTDESHNIIDEYENKYEMIKCIHIVNGGVSNARNVGLDNSKGNYITFVDADDYLDCDFIENMYNAADDTCDIVGSGFIAEYENNSVKKCVSTEYVFIGKQIIYQFLMAGVLETNITDKLFKKEVISGERFNDKIAIAEDKLFLFNCLKNAKQVKVIPFANYHYLMNDLSAFRKDFSINKFDSIIVSEYICEDIRKNYPEYLELAESMTIDVKCRVSCDMFYTKAYIKYKDEYLKMRKDIKKFSVKKKYRNSNKKHFGAFMCARIHPRLYCFMKNNMKLQYKNR